MVYDFGCTLLENKCLRYLQDYQSNTKIPPKKFLVVNTRIFTTILLLTVSSICPYLPCFADYALVKHVFESFERHHKYGQTTAFYGFLWKGKIMIKILFGCIRQWYEWKRRIGFWFCKSGQIVTLGKVHYYSFTTIQQMKKIYEHILFYCD